MKKILLLFSAVGMLSLTSCTSDDDGFVDNDTISEVFETQPQSFTAAGDFTVLVPLNPEIFTSDVVLVYRLTGLDTNNRDIWEPVPSTYYLDEGRLNYNFDFTTNSVALYLDATFNPSLRPEFFTNQIFRIVIVPGYFSDTVDVSNYNLVMSALQASGKTIKIEKR